MEDTIKEYKRYLENPNLSTDDREWYERYISEYQKKLAAERGNIADAKARLRYADSEVALQKPLERYLELKSNMDDLQRNVSRAESNLNNVKASGSDSSRENREELERLQRKLKDIRREIARVELELEGTDEEDAKAVAAAERKYEAAMSALGDAQAEMNALFRRG